MTYRGETRLGIVAGVLLFGDLASGQVTVGGNRPVEVHMPPSYDPSVPMALVIHLHGYWAQGNKSEIDLFGFPSLADEYGFLYAAPEGTDDGGWAAPPSHWRFWNATPACCGPPSTVDDSAYLRDVIAEASSQLNVDTNRIYLTGFSTGGFMSYHLACKAPQTIAALVSIAGATYDDPADCGATGPVHILQVHGARDVSVSPLGGTGFRSTPAMYPGALESAAQWAAIDGCLPSPEAGPPLDLLSNLAGAETAVTRFASGCEPGGSAELWLSAGADHFSYLSQPQFARQAIEWLFDHPKRPAPVASAALSTTEGDAPLHVELDGSASSSPDGATIQHYWTFGHGQTALGPSAQHTYVEPGRYTLGLTVFTSDGRTSRRSNHAVTVRCPVGSTGAWSVADVGALRFPGSARLEESARGSVLRLCAGGRDIGLREDECLLAHQELQGDFRITAEIAELLTSQVSAKVGIMARQGIDTAAAFAGVFLETSGTAPDLTGTVRFRYRDESGATLRTRGSVSTAAPRAWLRLERRGDVLTSWTSQDGSQFALVHEQVLEGLPGTLLVGIAATGRDVDPAANAFRPLQAAIANLSIEQKTPFHRGDANASGTLDLSDAISIFSFLFLGGSTVLTCKEAADANNDVLLDVSDGIYVLSWLFTGGPAPPDPGPPGAQCGVDPERAASEKDLGCESYPGCG